jgi:hypothetical protein
MSSCHASNKRTSFFKKKRNFCSYTPTALRKEEIDIVHSFPFLMWHLMCVSFVQFRRRRRRGRFNFFFFFFALLEDNRSTLFVVSSNLPLHHTVYIYDTGCCCCSVDDILTERMQIISWGVVDDDEENLIISLLFFFLCLERKRQCFWLYRSPARETWWEITHRNLVTSQIYWLMKPSFICPFFLLFPL